jgi:hypothetical protein
VIREDWSYSRPEKERGDAISKSVDAHCSVSDMRVADVACSHGARSRSRWPSQQIHLRMSLWSQRKQNHRKKRIKAASIGGLIIIPTRSVIGAIVSRQRRH